MGKKKYYVEKELQHKIDQMIKGKISYKDKDYQKILKALWKEYKQLCEEDTRIMKSRDKIVTELNSW